MKKTILITWWAWYIGSHAVLEFLLEWYEVVIIDNFSNSSFENLKNIEAFLGKKIIFYQIDIKNKFMLERVFIKHQFSWVLHFAWLKSVKESTEDSNLYYENNVSWSINIFSLMEKYGVKNIVFSSSATVYDARVSPPYDESDKTWNGISPYAHSKVAIESVLENYAQCNGFNVIILRYFNPIWAHSSSIIWEEIWDKPNNIFPNIIKSIYSQESYQLNIFWSDYNTIDGSCVRDYIDINDLIRGHLEAYRMLRHQSSNFFEIYNLWAWKWTTVLELVNAFERVLGIKLKCNYMDRRDGDAPIIFCNAEKAKLKLWWEAKVTIDQSIRNTIAFENNGINLWEKIKVRQGWN